MSKYYTVTINGTKETRSAPVYESKEAAEERCALQNSRAGELNLDVKYQVTEAEKTWCEGNEKVKEG